MKKSTKRFTVSSESVNSHGFRVLTDGIDFTHFNKNPLLLWMHQRATGGNRNEVLPLGFWEGLEVRSGTVTAVPVFDDKDPFALSISNKVENGTLRMASMGLLPLITEEVSGLPTVTKSVLKEISIVDIGSNADALAAVLYDENDRLIRLSDLRLRQGIALRETGRLASYEKDWDTLWRSGELESLRYNHPQVYQAKFLEKFGSKAK